MRSSAGLDRRFILLTGATGLVGGLVLARLLSCELPVAVLVRSNRRQSAVERVESLMRRLEERCGRLFVRPVILDGDLCSEGLGLSEFHRSWIADHCGSVIHSAANLLFRPAVEHPDNEPYRTNVEGTARLLEVLSDARIHEWHYVSTAYIAGLRSGRILEKESNVGQEFGNDYERSKTMSEQMLRQSQAIESLTVYRPSIVIDLHPTASMRSDQTINSAFAMFQALSQRFGLPERGDWFRRLGFSGDERKNIVTVDWVAAMIAQIYRRPALHGQTYHLTSPCGTSAAELEDGFHEAVLQSGAKLPKRRPEVTALIDEQAAPFVAAFKPYFKDDPTFDRTNTEHAMQVCREPDLTELTVETLRDFCLRQTRPNGLPVLLKSVFSTWERFATGSERGLLTEAIVAGFAAGKSSAEQGLQSFGLELYGPGGGQWLVEEASGQWAIRIGSMSAVSRRVLAAAETMSRLIEGRLTVPQAAETAVLLIEIDGMADVLNPGMTESSALLLEQFSRLIADVRRDMIEHNQESEVVHVG